MNLARHFAAEEIDVTEGVDVGLINQLAASQPYIEAWVGYDLDKTLFTHDKWEGPLHFGEPIEPMIEHLKATIASGKKAKIFTARVSYEDQRINDAVRKAIQALVAKHVGSIIEVTCIKDVGMREFYDDRARQVIENTGEIVLPKKNHPGTTAQFTKDLKAELGQE